MTRDGALSTAWRGRGATFVVHLTTSLAAVFACVPTAALLERAIADHPEGDELLTSHGAAAWVDLVHGWGPALRASLVAPLLVSIAVAAFSGPLACAWIGALQRGDPRASELVHQASRLALRAWALDALLLALRALTVTIGAASAYAVGAVSLGAGADDRTTGWLVASTLLLLASLLVPVGAAADVARAEVTVAARPVVRALLSALRASVRAPRTVTLPYVVYVVAGLGLAGISLVAGQLLEGRAWANAVAIVVVQQSLMLGRTFVRSVWLAFVASRAAPGVTEEAGDARTAAVPPSLTSG